MADESVEVSALQLFNHIRIMKKYSDGTWELACKCGNCKLEIVEEDDKRAVVKIET